MKFIRSPEAKDLIRKGEPPSNVLKEYVATAEFIGERQVRFTLSTSDPDRDNDVIRQDGWQLANFEKNPVVCWNHATDQLPIGRCIEISSVAGRLKGTVEFVPADVPVVGPLAEALFRMTRTGFISAVSVGFLPLQWEWLDDEHDGIEWQSQELMEWSLCTVPSNPNCLIEPSAVVEAARSSALNNRRAARQRFLLLRPI